MSEFGLTGNLHDGLTDLIFNTLIYTSHLLANSVKYCSITQIQILRNHDGETIVNP